MRKIIVYAFCIASALMFSGCAKHVASGVNDAEKRYFDAWMQVNHPDAQPSGLGVYIIDEEKGVYNEDGSLNLNPNSIQVLKDCYIEPVVKGAEAYDSFQFVRTGFFCVDSKDSTPGNLVFNRIVSLKSSFKLPN